MFYNKNVIHFKDKRFVKEYSEWIKLIISKRIHSDKSSITTPKVYGTTRAKTRLEILHLYLIYTNLSKKEIPKVIKKFLKYSLSNVRVDVVKWQIWISINTTNLKI